MNPRELLVRKSALIAEAKAIIDKAITETRALTDDESRAVDEKQAEAERLQATYDRASAFATPTPAPAQTFSPAASVSVHDNREDEPFRSLGEQLLAVRRSALTHEMDPRLRSLSGRAATGMGESVPSDGGFFVQKPQTDQILQRVITPGSILARCTPQPIAANANGIKIPGVDESSRADGYRVGGIRGYWIDEGGTFTASAPKFFMVELNLNKLGALVYLTDELVQDAAVVESFVMPRVPNELRFKAEDAVINGDGAGKPLGILAAACTYPAAADTGQAAATYLYENAIQQWRFMHPQGRANAVWLVNPDVEPQLYTMHLKIGTGGVPVFMPAGGASGAQFASLFTRPIIPNEYCAALGTVGDVIFADLSQYIFASKGGINTASSIHVQFLTEQSVLRFSWRIDGQPSWKSYVTAYKGSTYIAPFVTVATRS